MHQSSDIRNLSAGRAGASVVELRSVDAPSDVAGPIKRRFGPPKIVTREHINNAVRWTPGERLNHLVEEACIRFGAGGAVITDAVTLTYRDINRRANQLARHLIEQGIKPGDRVGLLFDRSPETYVAMLAVMKVNAAYVPLDAAFPFERVRFIIGDAELRAILSMAEFEERLAPLDLKKVLIDKAKRAIDSK